VRRGKAGCPENLMYPGQAYVQLLLVLVMLVCVPWMLLPKPLILKKRHEARLAAGYAELNDDDDADNSAHPWVRVRVQQCAPTHDVRFCRYRFPATDLNSKATWFGIQ
jgi:hypothetical protein